MSQKYWQSMLACILIGLVMAGTSMAAEFPDLSAQELKDRLDGAEKIFLLYPLSDIEFNEGHIRESVNIPLHLIPTTEKLPADKTMPIVSYCLGPRWVFYKKAASLVADMGYTQVMTFKGGIPEWVAAGFPIDLPGAMGNEKIPTLSHDELNAKLASVRVVDIRESALYEMGWIPGSVKIPLGNLSADFAAIPKDKPIVVVDHAGNQVLAASRFLKSQGYTNVERLQGGLMAWSAKGFALEK